MTVLSWSFICEYDILLNGQNTGVLENVRERKQMCIIKKWHCNRVQTLWLSSNYIGNHQDRLLEQFNSSIKSRHVVVHAVKSHLTRKGGILALTDTPQIVEMWGSHLHELRAPALGIVYEMGVHGLHGVGYIVYTSLALILQ